MKRPDEIPALSVIIPASNEARLIGNCLSSVLSSTWDHTAPVEVLVMANGCRDETAQVARAHAPDFAARGWDLKVIELAQGSKIGALNAGDAAAQAGTRAYVDADVTLSAPLLAQLHATLDVPEPRYASGTLNITAPDNAVSRAYAAYWRGVPFMAQGVPGCGVFAANAAGRARWHSFPDIISDDTFARLSFTPQERFGVPASYDWPVVEGLGNLIKVRRRQNRGVEEVAAKFPQMMANDDDRPFPLGAKLSLALRTPLGFAVYSLVAIVVKLAPGPAQQAWSRAR